MKTYRLYWLRLAVFFILAACQTPVSTPMERPATFTPQSMGKEKEVAVWPADSWRSSTPEEQGMDSEQLAQMMAYIDEEGFNLHGLLIARNGHIVTEAAFHPYERDLPHAVYSVSKSVVSTLIGIALTEGIIESLDQTMLTFFPDRQIKYVDARKEQLTLAHMLSMSLGMNWTEIGSESQLWMQSEDSVQYVLDRPMSVDPGANWQYNTGSSHLLGEIIAISSGMSLEEYSQSRLFEPLGIRSATWKSRFPDGRPEAGAGLMMTMQDAARLGYLYLKQGEWDGQQILPDDWVAQATKARWEVGRPSDSPGYGYQWWVTPDDEYYYASGMGDQMITIHPNKKLIIVFFSGGNRKELEGGLMRLIDLYILESVKSESALPENPEGLAELNRMIAEVGQVATVDSGPLPQIADEVSGKKYKLAPNDLDLEVVSFEFSEAENRVQLYFAGIPDPVDFPIGQGETFLVSANEWPGPQFGRYTAHRGRWISDDTYQMDLQFVDDVQNAKLLATFAEEELQLTLISLITNWVEKMQGTQQGE